MIDLRQQLQEGIRRIEFLEKVINIDNYTTPSLPTPSFPTVSYADFPTDSHYGSFPSTDQQQTINSKYMTLQPLVRPNHHHNHNL